MGARRRYYHSHYSLEHMLDVNVFAPADLLSVVGSILLGAGLFFGGLRIGLFHIHGPVWLSVEWLALAAGRGARQAWLACVDAWARLLDWIGDRIAALLDRAARALPMVDYLPGGSETQRAFSLLNLDFDFGLVLAVIAVVLLVLGLWGFGAVM